MIYWWILETLCFKECNGCEEKRPHNFHFTKLGKWWYMMETRNQ